jgi:acyl-CoA synthetase (AMP-forming)/AMP-acid ligase II/3-oxoacyl-(acyl-carrier-protein) synthase/acyl carrier protein
VPDALVDVLRGRAEHQPDRTGYRFLDHSGRGEPRATSLTYAELDARARAVAVTLAAESSPGDRVLLLCQPGFDYVAYFLGCLYAGRIAVPAYPPTTSRHTGRIEVIARDADAGLVVVDDPAAAPAGLRTLATAEALLDGREDRWSAPPPTGTDLAFLQYTSGSTAEPKGVMVTHGNLVANARQAEAAFALNPDSVGVSWLPPYHDMGLIGGIVFPLYTGFPTVLMSPVAFLRAPERWLEAISRFGGTVSPGPNFAYEMCAQRIGEDVKQRLDLSTWACALNGAEPVRPEVLDRFSAAFAGTGFRRSSFYPCYGLAESTLLVSGSRSGSGPETRLVSRPALEAGAVELPETVGTAAPLAASGTVVPGTEVVIVDGATATPVPPGRVGEIWVRGPGVAAGYFRAAEATRETFEAVLASGEGPYLRTGDLGTFIDGELFVTGRAGDLMIFRGRNVYPQDVEVTSEASHPLLAGARAAAFSVEADGEERLVVVQELARPRATEADLAEAAAAIRRAVAEEHLLQPYEIVLVPPRKIPVTSSGKTQRKVCRARYLAGDLPVPARPAPPPAAAEPAPAPVQPPAAAGTAADAVREIIARLAGRTPREVDLDLPFSEFGLDSVHAVTLAGELSDRLGTEIPATFVWDHASIADAVRSLAGEAGERPAGVPGPAADVPIAVVGIGCRFPGGGGVDGFWELLTVGRSGVGPVPRGRDVAGDGARGGFVEGVDGFDADLFGVAPQEAAGMDPQHRMVLEVAWEALEHAAIAPDRLRGSRTGVFVGAGGSDWATSGGVIDAYAATGAAVNFAANRLSYVLGLTGPSIVVDTACSSSLVALHLAARSLRDGECDQAIAGGVNVLLSPEVWAALEEGRMLSPGGACRTFDAEADGYVRGEGCGMVVLKRLPDAEAAGDEIWAVVRGTAVNHDGRSNGLTAPSGSAQREVIRAALAAARVAPAEVGYVEAHGTGTPLGDPVEVRALAGVLGEGRTRPLALGSVKTNIGHLEAAAGIAGFIKAVLAVRHGLIPPHLNLGRPNPHIDWDAAPLTVPVEPFAWEDGRRVAGVSSFGFGGTNAHAVLENHREAAA